MSRLLIGKTVSAALLPSLQNQASLLKEKGVEPVLALIRIGNRLSDVRYQTSIQKRCSSIGITCRPQILPENCRQQDLLRLIRQVNQDMSIHGCLIFRPFPLAFDDALIRASLAPEKDVDGITDASLAGLFTGAPTGYSPCTAAACMEILDHYDIPVKGRDVVVIGSSLVIGRPVAMEFLKREATVTICHIRTKDVGKYCRSADIIVSAAGAGTWLPPPWSVQDRPSSMWASTLQKTGESAAMWIFPTYPLLWTPSPRFPAASVPSLQPYWPGMYWKQLKKHPDRSWSLAAHPLKMDKRMTAAKRHCPSIS